MNGGRLKISKEWFDKNYIEGWHLDKDLIVKGNKVYSPTTCMLPPGDKHLLDNE